MKAIKTRPFKRLLLVVLSSTILTGCSGLPVQPNQVYKGLEQKVQYVYNAAAPIQQQGLVPALFKTVSMPGLDLLKKPMVFRANYRPRLTALDTTPAPKTVQPKQVQKNKQNEKDSNYIEQFYGL